MLFRHLDLVYLWNLVPRLVCFNYSLTLCTRCRYTLKQAILVCYQTCVIYNCVQHCLPPPRLPILRSDPNRHAADMIVQIPMSVACAVMK